MSEQVWVRLGDMEEGVHQLRQGLAQGVLGRHAVSGLLNATLSALSSEQQPRHLSSRRRGGGRGGAAGRRGGTRKQKKATVAWGWRVRPALEEAEEWEEGEASATARTEQKEDTPADRAWAYFTAAQRAATGRGTGALLSPGQYKLMVGLCRTADELRRLQADYTLHCTGTGRPARADSTVGAGAAASTSGAVGVDSGGGGGGGSAAEEDLGFAQSVYAAWMKFGDPAAAVEALERVLLAQATAPVPSSSSVASTTGAAASVEEGEGGGGDGGGGSSKQLRAPVSVRDRIGRYNSSTLLRLLQQRAGVATAAGRVEASNYLQILRRHGLADVYHYTIVLRSCSACHLSCMHCTALSWPCAPLRMYVHACAFSYLTGVSVLFHSVAGKRSELEALLDAMAADGIEHTAATSRTLAALERQLRS